MPEGDLERSPAAGAQLTADQGTSDPAAWRADATSGADQLRSGHPADDDALHEPAERDSTGDLLQRPPLGGCGSVNPW